MGRTFIARGGRLLVLLLLVGLSGTANAQLRIVPATAPAAVDPNASGGVGAFLQQATQLESEQRWGEALSIYEEALREHPDDPTLDSRRALAKIHYDLGRRYGDTSFLQAVSSLSERRRGQPVCRSAGENRVALCVSARLAHAGLSRRAKFARGAGGKVVSAAKPAR